MAFGATTAGRVAVDFVLNHDVFASGLRLVDGAIGKTVGSITRMADRVGIQLGRFQPTGAAAAAGLGVIGAAAGALAVQVGRAVVGAVQDIDRLSETAKAVGVSVRDLSSLRVAAEQGGVGIEELGRSVAFFNRQLAAAQGGGGKASLFAALGVDIRQDALPALIQLGQGLGQVENRSQQVAIAYQFLGRGGLRALNVVTPALAEQIALNERLGGTLSEDVAGQADEAANALDAMRLSVGFAKERIAAALLPSIVQVSRATGEWAARNREAVGSGLVSFLERAVQAIRGLQAIGDLPVLRQLGQLNRFLSGAALRSLGSLAPAPPARTPISEANSPFVQPDAGAPVDPAAIAAALRGGGASVATIFAKARAEVAALDRAAALLPPSFDAAGAKASVITDALKAAAATPGFDPAAADAKALAADLAALSGGTAAVSQEVPAVRAGAASVAKELAGIAAAGRALGPSSDVAEQSIQALRGAVAELAARGEGASDSTRTLQREIARLAGGTAALDAELSTAAIGAQVFGDGQAALETQARASEGALRTMIDRLVDARAVLGETDPTVVQLAASVDQLAARTRTLTAAASAGQGLTQLREYAKTLDAIERRGAILRGAGLAGGGVVPTLEARAQTGRAEIDRLTGPTIAPPASPEEAAARTAQIDAVVVDVQGAERSLQVAGAIEGAFTTAADGIAQAFDRSVLGIIQGTTTLSQAAAAAGQSIALEFAGSAVKAAAAWTAKQASLLAIEAATQAGLIGTAEAGAAVRGATAATEAGVIAGAKGAEVAAHVAGEATKTGVTVTASGTRQGLTLSEVATSIGAKAVEVGAWVAGEGAKLAASLVTFAVAIAGTLQIVAGYVAMGAALAIAVAATALLSIVTPLFALAAGFSAAPVLVLAGAYKALAIAAAAASVAIIPYVGAILAPIAAAATGTAIAAAAAIPIISAAGGAVIDRDQIAQVHARETILPAALSQGFQRIIAAQSFGAGAPARGAVLDGGPPSALVARRAASVGRGGDGERAADAAGGPRRPTAVTHVTVNAVDGRSMERWMRRNGGRFARVMAERAREYDSSIEGLR